MSPSSAARILNIQVRLINMDIGTFGKLQWITYIFAFHSRFITTTLGSSTQRADKILQAAE
ncbi:hypothetical protein N7519_004059 [Penicillium mononematosum]|uniref:uncharacterized protein n=1 Tax=Penicillium mononematosum TaxID=268346 RepID=UPI00254662E1|nr:uncharacterized protein N7519_004059 [Penicillium mononematosum]KAJ6189151.1 hypothetical protein N7519_004059 [Penicillium mononematosum]